MKKAILALFTLVTLLFPIKALASNYGECGYGTGNYNEGGCTTSTTTTSDSPLINDSTTPKACQDQAPGVRVPWLYGAIAQSSSSITLYFTEADAPITKYVLEYGTKSGEYQYGVQDMGVNERHQMTFEVGSLSSNTTYYFRIRGQNGCATGEWSNEISAKTKGMVSLSELDFVDTKLTTETKEEVKKDSCEPYTVVSGDTLWKIAKNVLGDGNRYKEIIEANKDKYSSLATSNTLSSGWELMVSCSQEDKQREESISEKGYEVNVKVVDKAQKPVEGARVTLHSDPKEAVTDKDGLARFTGVEGGEHRVLIAYNNYEGEQSLYLSGDSTETFNINVTVEPKNILLSKEVLIIVGVAGVVIAFLVYLLIRRK